VSTEEHLVDVLMKSLRCMRFSELRGKIGIIYLR
jgi:hypothetical protein